MSKSSVEYWDRHKAIMRERYASDPAFKAEVIKRKTAWQKKNRDKENARIRKLRKKQREELHDSYIKKLIMKHGLISSAKHISPDLIEIYRLKIKLERAIAQDKSHEQKT